MPKSPENEIDISFVIVTWNSSLEIESCLRSVIECKDNLRIEVIVIDNASGDDTAKIIKNFIPDSGTSIRLIENKENFGYTSANNQGFEIANGEYIFLLNPDTMLKKNSLKILKDFLDTNKGTGAAAPQLLNPDGSIQFSCRTFPRYWDMFCEIKMLPRLFPKSRIFARWKMKYFSHDKLREVDQPMAAALMVRSDVMKEVNYFDSQFGMFFNDVDLCKKIYDSGYKIYFIPGAKVIHLKGKSIYKDRKRMIKVWNNDCLKYFRKYHYNFLLYNMLKAGLYVSGVFRRMLSTT